MSDFLEVGDADQFQQSYFTGCPLPNKSLGF